MAGILFIVAVILFVICILLHRKADKLDEEFVNRPMVITNPSKDLFVYQKYAIVKLLAFVQGASPKSAFDEEAAKIVNSTIFSLGLSQNEVEKELKHSMRCEPDAEMHKIFRALNEIKDRDYLRNLYQKCLKVAYISGDDDTIESTNNIFAELGIF